MCHWLSFCYVRYLKCSLALEQQISVAGDYATLAQVTVLSVSKRSLVMRAIGISSKLVYLKIF